MESVVHVGWPFPLCGAVVVVDVVGTSQVVHLLLPAWWQRRQQLLRPLGTRVGSLVPALRFYKRHDSVIRKCRLRPEDPTLSLFILSLQTDGHSQVPEGRFRYFLLDTAALARTS